MGCNAAKNVAVVPIDGQNNGHAHRDRPLDLDPGEVDNATVNNVLQAGNGMSFEITFEESEGKQDTVSQKQPPKRLQEVEPKDPVTLEKLQEKLEEAEIRRQQILQQRGQSATQLKRQRNGGGEGDSPNHLKVPNRETKSRGRP